MARKTPSTTLTCREMESSSSGNCTAYGFYASPLARAQQGADGGGGLPLRGMPAACAQTVVENFHLLDFNPLLNTSSYVNVVFEPEEIEVAKLGMSVSCHKSGRRTNESVGG